MPSHVESTDADSGISKTFYNVQRFPDRKSQNFRLENKISTGSLNKIQRLHEQRRFGVQKVNIVFQRITLVKYSVHISPQIITSRS